MDMFTPYIIWNVFITLVLAPLMFGIRKNEGELKRQDILLNKTREEYSTKEDLRDTSGRVMEALHRLEDKLDKVLSK